MSYTVQVDYGHISCQCNSVCELAEDKLIELEEMIKKIESSSTTLLNEQTEALKRQIKKEKNILVEKISTVRQNSLELAKKEQVIMDDESYEFRHRNDIIHLAEELKGYVDELSSSKIVEFEGLLRNLLTKNINDNYQRMVDESTGRIVITEEIENLLNSIEDEILRQYVYIAYIEDNSLRGEKLVKAGKDLMNETYEDRYEKEVNKIREELEKARVDKTVIDKVTKKKANNFKDSLKEMRQEATNEIIDEKIRAKSLHIIKKAIKQRGFIVDKNNIKINKEKNEVIMVALKASGEKAEFKVYMDGKFIYDFHGYEGQACQKDIEPFLKDLEEVYGMNIKKTTEIWKNPNKISTMKYQAIKTNKLKG